MWSPVYLLRLPTPSISMVGHGKILLRLRTWLQDQGGFKIDDRPISSTDTLFQTFHLLWPDHQSWEPVKSRGSCRIVMEVVYRFVRLHLKPKQKESTLDDLVVQIPRRNLRKCSACGSRILDDPSPTFGARDTSISLAHMYGGGCGSSVCAGDSF